MKHAKYLAVDTVRERVSVGDDVGSFLYDIIFVLETDEEQGEGILGVDQAVAQQLSDLDLGHD